MTWDRTIKARVTLAELAQVDVLAAERKMKRSEYIRRAALAELDPDPALVVLEPAAVEILAPQVPKTRVGRLLQRLRRR